MPIKSAFSSYKWDVFFYWVVGFLRPKTNTRHTQRFARPLGELTVGIKAINVHSHPVLVIVCVVERHILRNHHPQEATKSFLYRFALKWHMFPAFPPYDNDPFPRCPSYSPKIRINSSSCRRWASESGSSILVHIIDKGPNPRGPGIWLVNLLILSRKHWHRIVNFGELSYVHDAWGFTLTFIMFLHPTDEIAEDGWQFFIFGPKIDPTEIAQNEELVFEII
ncbi:hypothetical protein BDR03DRAFT_984971 [Suillus americanus]|nr:hypothetical protein BDR03DRAFT_984971 [Suillus americanus]